jgi:periplasmic divalent cation tolerance protein
MKQSDHIVVFVTAGAAGEAEHIAKLLLEKRKAACVNIVPEIDSHFWWQGKKDCALESLLVIKTRAALLPEIIDLVKGVHSFTIPEIIAMPIIGGNPEYLNWIDEETS